VSVTFDDFKYTTQIEEFSTWLVHSSWLATVGRDYGFQTGTYLQKAVLDAGASVLDAGDVVSFLNSQFDAGTVVTPGGANSNAVYVVYLPADAGVAGACQSYYAYHDWGTYETTPYAYALIPDCPGDITGLLAPGNLEVAATHEIAEAASDPYPPFNDAGSLGYYFNDPTSLWYNPDLGEIADFCEGPYWQDPDAGFYAHLIWSNTAAQAGNRSPCLPDNGAAYFNVSPSPATVPTVDAGGSFTFTLTGWSSSCTDVTKPYGVAVMQVLGAFDSSPLIDGGVLPDGGMDPIALMINGDTTTVTLSVPPTATSGQLGIVWIGSYQPGSPTWSSYSPVSVIVR
jgi:hypothetical protein